MLLSWADQVTTSKVYPNIHDKVTFVHMKEFSQDRTKLKLKKYTFLANEEFYDDDVYEFNKDFTPEFSKLTGEILWVNTDTGITQFGEFGEDALYLKTYFPGLLKGDIEWAEIEYSNFDTSVFLLHSVNTEGDRRIHFNRLGEEPILVCDTIALDS